MPHRHKIYDTDPTFSINPITRLIKNETSKKITLIQHDHNSERFTFEIPRYIEEHDMSECNVVQVHYINIESGNRNQNEDVYDVTDLHISPDDDDKVICSWLISQNATKYVGSLNFVVRFSCVTDGVIDYAWNTAVYSGISVSSGIFNTDVIAIEYSDILAQWTARIEALEKGGSGGGSGGGLTNEQANILSRMSIKNVNPDRIAFDNRTIAFQSDTAGHRKTSDPVPSGDVEYITNEHNVSTVEQALDELFNEISGVGTGKRPTETIELSYSNGDIDFVIDTTTKSVKAVSYGDSAIPLSSEIQKIEILFNDDDYPDWINLQEMINYDPQNPYILFANKPFLSETEYMPIYFRIYFVENLNVIASLIDSYKVNKVRITYYTD